MSPQGGYAHHAPEQDVSQRMVVKMIEVEVHALSTNPLTQQPIVWLRNQDDNTVLPIGVGGTEVASIYSELANEPSQRPLTHDLIGTVLEHFDAEVEQMRIVRLDFSHFGSPNDTGKYRV